MRLSVPIEVSASFEFGGEECLLLFRQPSRREYMLRQQLLNRVWRDGGWGTDVEWASAVYFTLRECELFKAPEIGAPKDAPTVPLWNPMALKNGKLSWKEFLAGWHAIYPPEIATLLYDEAVKVAPDWETRQVVTAEEQFQEWPGVSSPPEE